MAAEQETLRPNPDDGGLWSRYLLRGGSIDHHAWLRARAEGARVGTCRRCGGDLVPEAPEERAGRIDYEARCLDPSCGYLLAAPGGRALRRSAKWSDHGGAARVAAMSKQAKGGNG